VPDDRRTELEAGGTYNPPMVESTNYGVIAGYAAVEQAARAADAIAVRASTKIALLVRKGTRVIPVSPPRRQLPTPGSTTASRARQRERAWI
jgi:hypothetical protein